MGKVHSTRVTGDKPLAVISIFTSAMEEPEQKEG
jgi:hypothetical protein